MNPRRTKIYVSGLHNISKHDEDEVPLKEAEVKHWKRKFQPATSSKDSGAEMYNTNGQINGTEHVGVKSTQALRRSQHYPLVVYMSLSSGFDMPKSICGCKFCFNFVSDRSFVLAAAGLVCSWLTTWHSNTMQLYSSNGSHTHTLQYVARLDLRLRFQLLVRKTAVTKVEILPNPKGLPRKIQPMRTMKE